MISVKNHHITAIVRVDIDLESEDLEIKTSCQMLWGGIVSKYSNCLQRVWIVIVIVYFGRISQPCPRKEPMPNQRAFEIVQTCQG